MAQQSQDDACRQLCQDILDHPRGDYRISVLAARMNMTERTFIRRFSRELHISPAKFVEKVRLDAARCALEETTLNLDQIAHDTGFQSLEVLRRTFQRHMAISPKEYRARFGG